MDRPAVSLPHNSFHLSPKGTAKLGKAAEAFSADAALAALGSALADELRVRAETLYQRHGLALVNDALTGQRKAPETLRQWRAAEDAAEAAAMLSKSSTVREYVLAFAKRNAMDPFLQTRHVIEGWVAAGRPAPSVCPECNSFTVHLPGEPEDSDVGLGARDAGLACTNCHWDSRVCHPLTSRGSNLPFLG